MAPGSCVTAAEEGLISIGCPAAGVVRDCTRIAPRGYEAMERKLRLWSGLLIAMYVVLHLANHALGLISIVAMEYAREGMQALWGTPVMLALLYGSFAVHFSLTLAVLYRRSTRKDSVVPWRSALRM